MSVGEHRRAARCSSQPIQGDYELVQIGLRDLRRAAACRSPARAARTSSSTSSPTRASARTQRAARRVRRAAARRSSWRCVAWRTARRHVSMHAAGETTTILGLPIWWTLCRDAAGRRADRDRRRSPARWRDAVARRADEPASASARCCSRAMLVLMAVRVPIAIAMFVPGRDRLRRAVERGRAAQRISRARSSRASRSTTCR